MKTIKMSEKKILKKENADLWNPVIFEAFKYNTSFNIQEYGVFLNDEKDRELISEIITRIFKQVHNIDYVPTLYLVSELQNNMSKFIK
jgi:hypothetical protein